MRFTRLHRSRSTRPYPVGSGTIAVSIRPGAPVAARWVATMRIDAADSSGVSPGAMTTVPSIGPPLRSSRAASARRTACPVPSWVGWKTTIASGAISARCASTCSRALPVTTTTCSGFAPLIAVSTWASMLRPQISCSTFGVDDFMREPSPAASTIAAATVGSAVALTSPAPYLVCCRQPLRLAAPGGGFEPPFMGPKPIVLPLDDPGSTSAPRVRKSGSRPLTR